MKLELQLSDLDEDSLDMTPLIDVIFLLLTFFILAATFVAPAMDVELAKAKNVSANQAEDKTLTFSIDAEGLLFFEQTQINEEELKRILSEHDKDVPLIFNVDQKAPFESFMLVLDEAKSQEKQRFYINGRPKGEAAGQASAPGGATAEDGAAVTGAEGAASGPVSPTAAEGQPLKAETAGPAAGQAMTAGAAE